ncbi:vWA domain-containing protein [Dactylosporangium sp. CS-033363]|uniref:vWA domain-containing protein n=1 Tax=Dactylosporangium sp. CS-033363 TaxID=3239935 RepID=UPI003D9216A0
MKRFAAFTAALTLTATVLVAQPAAAYDILPPVTCTWLTPEYPHISTWVAEHTGDTDIKTGTQGECDPADDPVEITAQMVLEKQVAGGAWAEVLAGTPITKNAQGRAQTWGRGELFVRAPCTPGVYRGRLNRTAKLPGGAAFLLGDDIVSPAVPMDCKPKRIGMVIDDTGSMTDVIGAVKTALNGFITGQPADLYTRWSLTTFKDAPTTVGTTEDRAQILSWVAALTASGGGDCPEDVLGGIGTSLTALGTDPATDKQLLVATDASAQPGDVDALIAKSKSAGVRINVLLTGDCSEPAAASVRQGSQAKAAAGPPLSSQVVLQRMAKETGGRYYFLPEATAASLKKALDEIFADFATVTPPPASPTPSPRASGTAGPQLPVTGSDIPVLVTAGAVLLGAGLVLLLVGLRRRRFRWLVR